VRDPARPVRSSAALPPTAGHAPQAGARRDFDPRMSGICGIVAKDGEPSLPSGAVRAMCSRLAFGASAPRAPEPDTLDLGSAQLGASLFGRLVGGTARASFQDATVALVLCGSIYDSSGNDASAPAQALLDRYLREGIALLESFDGEAALAIWDGRSQELHVATDPFRIHPIFYSDGPDHLVFASRIDALLHAPVKVPASIRPDAVVDTVGSSVIPTPKTIFREIAKLPPGHRLTCRKGRATALTPYWRINFLDPSRDSEAELTAQLRERFSEAVSRRLRGDGPVDRVGTFLSGGIDSSTVTGVAMRSAGRPIKSFSIGFGEARFNEMSYARIAARALGAEHFEYFVVPADVSVALPALLASFDEPYGNASAVPTYLCARLAKENGVDALYAGDGGDELFAGNERYAAQRVFQYFHRIPPWLGRGVIRPAVNTLADLLGWDLLVKGKKYIRRASLPGGKRLTSYEFFNVVPPREFLTADFLAEVGSEYDPGATVERLYDEALARNELDRQLYVDLLLTISDNDLLKVTRMTEAAGVTVRFPFLDRHLAEFAMRVPASLKMRGSELRTFFKRAYSDLLPLEVRTKTKHGFGLPIARWLQTEPALREMMHDLVLSPRSVARGYFQKRALEDLVRRHEDDSAFFFGTTLWNLMILELWLRGIESPGGGAAAGPPPRA
jgi:asparagine synthase (glutamine-hydrolysing)